MSKKSNIFGKRIRSELNHKSVDKSLNQPKTKKLKREHKQNHDENKKSLASAIANDLEDGEIPSVYSAKMAARIVKENEKLKEELQKLNDNYEVLKNKFHNLIKTHQKDLNELQKYRKQEQLQLKYRALCSKYPFKRWCRKLETCKSPRCQFAHPNAIIYH